MNFYTLTSPIYDFCNTWPVQTVSWALNTAGLSDVIKMVAKHEVKHAYNTMTL